MAGEIKHIDVGSELTKVEWEATTTHIINDVAALQTSLFATALPENVSLILDASIGTEGNYSGITEAGVLGETVLLGQIVYLNSSSKWVKAKADAVSTSTNKLGICLIAGILDGATSILLFGKQKRAPANVSLDYLVISNCSATPGDTWYAGASSTNVSGNTGWIFTVPPV